MTAEKLYLSSKLPFAYNYADHNYTVDHHNDAATEYGSHVAEIAASTYVPSLTTKGECQNGNEGGAYFCMP